MQITINTEVPLSESDKSVLRALLGEVTNGVTVNVDSDTKRVPAKKAAAPKPEPDDTPELGGPEKPAPVKKTAAKRAPAKKAAAPEPEPDEDGNDETEDLDPMDLAVARATELLSEGRSADVKEALKAAGAKKVSELKGAGIQKFLDALD